MVVASSVPESVRATRQHRPIIENVPRRGGRIRPSQSSEARLTIRECPSTYCPESTSIYAGGFLCDSFVTISSLADVLSLTGRTNASAPTRFVVILLPRQLLFHRLANHLPIDAHASSGKACHGSLHHRAHVFHRRSRRHLRNRRPHSGHNLFFPGSLRQIGFDQLNLSGFLVGHLLASAFGELLDRVHALLDQRGENLLRFLVVERRHLFNLAVLKRGLHHAQR